MSTAIDCIEDQWLQQVAKYLHMRRMSRPLQQAALQYKALGYGSLYSSIKLREWLESVQ